MYRLEAHPAEWVDRSVTLKFTFEGREYRGFRGDTITSALAAAGVAFLGRSFKYHRPRTVSSFANTDINTLFQVDGVANVRGDVTLLREGMRVTAVNTFGGLAADRARILDRFARFLPVGFYYKAFHGKKLFPRWERMFRVLTGLGTVDTAAPRGFSPKRYGFCDVLVIGAGPSGLSAALAAAHTGAKVALVEENFRLGGSGNGLADGSQDATQEMVKAVSAEPAIKVFRATYAAAYYGDYWVPLVGADWLTKMRAKAVVFASGVLDQPAVFRNNDLPGVMSAAGALRMLARYRVAPGLRVTMIAGNLEAYRACLDLRSQGIGVAAIVDLRATPEEDEAIASCRELGIQILLGYAPYEAIAGVDGRVRALDAAPLAGDGRVDASQVQRVECDAVLMSVGYAAAAQLFLQAGGKSVFSDELQQFVPEVLPTGVYATGRMNGVYEFAPRVADGRRAGLNAAAHAGFGVGSDATIVRTTRRPSHRFPIVDHARGKNFVDFDEDLQVKDLQNAVQEGFDSSELLKRYSTVGMGPSQGKHSHMNALRVLARERRLGVAQLGLTTARPMYHPVPLKLLAGRSFNPERRTPLDQDHRALGAVWMPAGNWRRPEYYAIAGESRAQSIEAEVRAVRTSVGIIDVGTLGKIEIFGADAGEFLDRVYAGRYSNMAVGTSRYGLMLDESGVIVDDGVVARLAEDAFYFTTTTGGSATVFRELLRLNALWGLDCTLVNLTGHRAAVNVAGPKSRALLQPLVDIDLSEAAFPYLALRHATLAGHAVRMLRVGFVGEWGYEIHMPHSAARSVWAALHAAGRAQGLRAFGVEAQRVLRLEKGHFIIGQDTDGLTDPLEANAKWAVSRRKPFFVGARSLAILERRGPRQVLVGFELLDSSMLPKECHLVIQDGHIAGRVTSIAYSPTLGKAIGLAMLTPTLADAQTEFDIRGEGGVIHRARRVATPFYDAHNARQREAGGASA